MHSTTFFEYNPTNPVQLMHNNILLFLLEKTVSYNKLKNKTKLTNIKSSVKIKVIWGVIDGKTVCSNSWTRPPVIEAELLYLIKPKRTSKIKTNY